MATLNHPHKRPRLRAATSIPSPLQYSPSSSCMAIRRTGRTKRNIVRGQNETKSLAAIAGPMGITILDMDNSSSHQLRPWLSLDYGGSGGIFTMAFQPCPSSSASLQEKQQCSAGLLAGDRVVDIRNNNLNNNNNGCYHYSYNNESSILLATARGSGILVWDISGRVLSPLLGLLNASNDSWGGADNGTTIGVNNTHQQQQQQQPPQQQQQQLRQSQISAKVDYSTTATTARSTFSAEDYTPAIVSTNTARGDFPSAVTMTTTTTASTTTTPVVSNNPILFTGKNKNIKNIVTSLEWKGPSAPILLATCGEYASVWDLRTSMFSGTGMGGSSSGGARPNARYRHTARSGLLPMLIHCAYCHDESKNAFATLDSMGVVSVWDDRKADNPMHSFLACPGGGVGIASIISPTSSSTQQHHGGGGGIGLRWVTWGMDNCRGHGIVADDDNLVVKVWSEYCDVSTASGNDSGDVPSSSSTYKVTSRISSAGAITARVHPSFPDGILLFRENHFSMNNEKDELLTAASGLEGSMNEGLLESAADIRTTSSMASPEISVVPRPSSPPTLVLESVDPMPLVFDSGGWEAELWRIDTEAPAATETIKSTVEESINAQKIVAFLGGGVEEDALSFAPGRRRDASTVIAADLVLGSSANHEIDELSLCVLTDAGQLTVYGVIEASTTAQVDSSPKIQGHSDIKLPMAQTPASVYCKATANPSASIEWWENNEEEDLFSDTGMALNRPMKNPIVDDSSQNDVMSDDIGLFATSSSIMNDVGLDPSMKTAAEIREDDPTTAIGDLQHKPIDPNVASRVPCPPLCGVAFSGVGSLVMFNNGPVKRLWSYYQSNKSIPKPSKSHNDSKTGNNIVSSVEYCKDDFLTHDQHSAGHQTGCDERFSDFPKTLIELIDMNLRGQTLQWGDGDNLQLDENVASDDNGGNSSGESSSYEDGDMISLESDKSSRMHESEGSECSADNLFDEYFSSSRQSLLGTDQNVAPGDFVGLPSLSSSVAVTNKYRDTLLSNQTPQLANLLMLDMKVSNFTLPDSAHYEKSGIGVYSRNSSPSDVVTQTSEVLPTHSSQLCSSKQGTIMGNLKKLFANQLPSAMTPPDQRLCKLFLQQIIFFHPKPDLTPSSVMNKTRQNAPKVFDPEVVGYNTSDSQRPNVYMIPNSQISETASNQVAISQKLCLHNSEVCSQLGQTTKADTWTLLGQTLHSVLTFELDETDGWGSDKDALTSGVIEQILRFYEVQGDFQMLSTIVCVLSFGSDMHCPVGSIRRRQLLPRFFDERRFDNYLHQYAALLYGWGFLNKRSEISKRLNYPAPSSGPEAITWTGSGKHVLLPDTAPMVDEDSSHYPLQCSICCNVVHGICTWCPRCGHGKTGISQIILMLLLSLTLFYSLLRRSLGSHFRVVPVQYDLSNGMWLCVFQRRSPVISSLECTVTMNNMCCLREIRN
jgi:hypothetical protein